MPSLPISVIIPAYTHPLRMLRDAIESVLAQTCRPCEIIVVDDGAMDPLAPQLSGFGNKIRVCRQANSGIGQARNAGVQLASGKWLAFLDSDDMWEPGKLEWQSALMKEESTLEAVYGHVTQFYDEHTDEAFRTRHPIRYTGAGWLSSTVLISHDAFDRIGPFSASTHGDVDWRLRCVEANLRDHMLDRVVMRRRIHTGNYGLINRATTHSASLRALKQSLDRRRALGLIQPD